MVSSRLFWILFTVLTSGAMAWMTNIQTHVSGHGERLGVLETQTNGHGEQLKKIDSRLDRIDSKLDRLLERENRKP